MSNNTAPADENEVSFPFEELFFSRTDERGIILSGNNVFQRISMYQWEELLKKPHNLIRHPDMPKAVFWLLWDTLKKGEPIGAYVKNRAKDGRYYWVFAIATPIKDGYLSVRLKPSSEILGIVEQEYKNLLTLETTTKLTPKDSAIKLLERLKQLGFNNYGEFMSAALGREIEARSEKLGRPGDHALEYFEELMQSAKSLLDQADGIFVAYEKNEYVPLNLRVQSAQLAENGATIGVISRNYNIISSEIKDLMAQFMTSAQEVFKTINDGRFLVCTARIQQEVIEFFSKEEPTPLVSQKQEMSYLSQQQKEYRSKALEGIIKIMKKVSQFQQDCDNMRMLSLGLEVTRVMGKVETSRLNETKDGLKELIDDLETFQTTISASLKEIEQMNRRIKPSMQKLLEEVEMS